VNNKKKTKTKEITMQETFKISDSAIKLNYILNVIAYSQNDTQEIDRTELRERLRATSKFLYNENIKEQCEINYVTILTVLQVSKAIEDDDMMIKAYEFLIKERPQSDDINKLFKSNINLFEIVDDRMLNLISNLLLSIGVTKIEDTYKELDMLQVDIFNKPLHIG
jgi:hypothetical protein